MLEEIGQRLKSNQEVDPKHLQDLLEFLQVFVDKCHHHKEEDVLFPAMEEAGIPKEDGPIGMMLLEHDEGRGFVQQMAQAVEKYIAGDKTAGLQITASIQGYAPLLTEHIEKEDNILYYMADMHLSSSKQKQLLTEFEKIEREKVGKGKHEQFHELLHNLETIYLK
ncbi:MAG: hemerythrin domain-containing protein [Patescibacteria group bacterium]|nr:hemerythrin domain-containing protein [Patescibacteria group bacterium]